ncbi:transcriptional regulator CysB-like protein [Azoarcus olearius]|uniref:LysR substrate-binding domain-containing protein n=1 Tax=Azoarcus sp. (strain BH72) TaxID=418699 RepID=UPI00080615FA|nr:LysR substrate-binding domain-containing protein [Azoarcus olearius]ANQ85487.1 transcriptional regulator CysB-like protein [Azoarcus olearius]
MNVSQLRLVLEAIRQNFNLSGVASSLFISQPGVSRQIKELEDELGVELFERRGKRLTGLTPPGEVLVPVIDRILLDVRNLKQVADRFAIQDCGQLRIASTHTQARYLLPAALHDFRARFPKVKLVLQQGTPAQIAEWVANGEADLGVSTEAIDRHRDLQAFPVREWHHAVIVPPAHPLAAAGELTLAALAEHPLVTYGEGFAGRSVIDAAFSAAGLAPDVVLAALDADVIVTYVEAGFGVGIVAEMAARGAAARGGVAQLDARHLFGPNVARVAVRRGAYLREYALELVAMLAAERSLDDILSALQRDLAPRGADCAH